MDEDWVCKQSGPKRVAGYCCVGWDVGKHDGCIRGVGEEQSPSPRGRRSPGCSLRILASELERDCVSLVLVGEGLEVATAGAGGQRRVGQMQGGGDSG